MITKKIHILLIVLLLFCFGYYTLSAQTTEWKLVSKNDSLNIYTRKSSESDIKEVKITGTLSCSQESIIEALNDIKEYKNWVYKCSDSYQIDTVEANQYHYYSRTNLPSPFKDRELVAYSIEWMDKDMVWHSNSIACPYKIPENRNVVRIKKYHSNWKVKAISPSIVEFEYFISLDTGGVLPAWIINIGITIGPKNTIRDLEKRSKEIMKN